MGLSLEKILAQWQQLGKDLGNLLEGCGRRELEGEFATALVVGLYELMVKRVMGEGKGNVRVQLKVLVRAETLRNLLDSEQRTLSTTETTEFH